MSEQNLETSKPFYKKWEFWFVIIYSLFILIYTALFIIFEDKIVMLTSNELGDFLAGCFAPLAFLFLYLGYKRQGEELKQNTQALMLQATQLQNSVKQQTDLVNTAKKDLEITINKITKDNQLQLIQAQPFFHITEIKVKVTKVNKSMDFSINFKIKNSRTMCRSLFFLFSLNEKDPSIPSINSTPFDILDINTTHFQPAYFQTTISGEIVENFNSKFFLHFCYTDAFDNIQIKTFKINLIQQDLVTYCFDSYVSQSQTFY